MRHVHKVPLPNTTTTEETPQNAAKVRASLASSVPELLSVDGHGWLSTHLSGFPAEVAHLTVN